MQITSPAFRHNELMPSKYTCEGANISPPIEISNIPSNAKSLVLIVDDPDAPGWTDAQGRHFAGTWDHWIVWNIEPTNKIDEDSVPGIQGRNSWSKNNYGGPCPPSGTHRYFFKLYALDTELNLSENSTKHDVEKAMHGHIVEKAELIGLYKKHS